MGLWLWHWNEGPIIPTGGSNVPKTQKISSSSIECQGNADIYLNLRALFTTSTFLKAPQPTRFTTLKYWNVWGTPSEVKGQKCGEVTTGFSITTTLQPTQNPWVCGQTLDHCSSLPHSPDLAPCDFFLFPKLKKPSKEEDLRRFRRLRQLWRKSLKPPQKKRTRTVSRSGNTVGISACVGEESTMKATQTCNLQIEYFF